MAPGKCIFFKVKKRVEGDNGHFHLVCGIPLFFVLLSGPLSEVERRSELQKLQLNETK